MNKKTTVALAAENANELSRKVNFLIQSSKFNIIDIKYQVDNGSHYALIIFEVGDT